MDKIEKIRAEIERLKGYISVTHFAEDLISFLDTLKEPVSNDLEEAAESYEEERLSDYGYRGEWSGAFIAGANWQKEQMLKDAVEGYVNYYEDSGGILMAEAQVGCPYHNGDKVRIIIVKEESI